MNMRCVAGFALMASMGFAADTPLAENDERIELPALSLKDAARERLPKLGESREIFIGMPATPQVFTHKDYTLKQLVPGAEVDPKLVVKPDDSTRYTLIIKDPSELGKRER